MPHPKILTGLVAAAHTPFAADGSLRLEAVERQAAHLLERGIDKVFIAGSTGECHSLSVDERRRLTARWVEVARGTQLQVIVHVGSNCLTDAALLAEHAQQSGAAAVSALCPSYFKPRSVDVLIDGCRQVAAAAPGLPFYYYDIPVLTGVSLSPPEFIEKAPARIANLAGLKYTNQDLAGYQFCLQAEGGRFDVPWGYDDGLLAALALGAEGAVGSTYNFAAPVYQRLWRHFQAGDLPAARREQLLAAQIIRCMAGYGFLSASKVVMAMLGVDVGPIRLPNAPLDAEQTVRLRRDLETLGFFESIADGR